MRAKKASWIPHHIERIVQNNSTAASLNSTSVGGRLLLISVETQAARVRFDSTAPTTNTGILIQAAQQPFVYEGYNGADLGFFRDAGGTSIITVASFTRPSS